MLIFERISSVHQLFVGEAAPDLALEIVERHVLRFELTVELLLGEGRLDLGELGFYLFVRGDEVELGSALLLDVVVDELAKDVQMSDLGLHLRGLLRTVAEIAAVIAFQRGPVNGMAVDCRRPRRAGEGGCSRRPRQASEAEPEGGVTNWGGWSRCRIQSAELRALGLLREARRGNTSHRPGGAPGPGSESLSYFPSQGGYRPEGHDSTAFAHAL